MLKDEIRTRSYQTAIYKNPHLFKDKVVLDVGCGTGILSLFAAKAGAKLVIGVDMSNIIDLARKVIEDNGYEERIILLKGRMEDLVLPVKEVDIIISEWMGYCLLYESMLNTIIAARDKYLKDGGLLFPDRASLYITTIEDAEYKQSKIEFWDDVYGFDFSAIKKIAIREPLVDFVEPETINTIEYTLKVFDLYTVTAEDLEFSERFTLRATRNDYIHAFLCYFNVEFTACRNPISISTSPRGQQTHWKQTVFYLHDQISVRKGDRIDGIFSLRTNKSNNRDLEIDIEFNFTGETHKTQVLESYKMC